MYHLGYGGYIGGVQGYPLITRPDSTWDWSEHFSWVKGNHTIKMGGNFQRASTNSTRNNARTGLAVGYFTYYTGYMTADTTGVTDDIEQLLLGKADNANREFGNTHRYITQNSVGFYAQDDWKIKPRLTLNFGLRYEINGTMRDKNNQEANFFPDRGFVQVGQGIDGIHNVDYHDFGPHVGFAWDMFGNGTVGAARRLFPDLRCGQFRRSGVALLLCVTLTPESSPSPAWATSLFPTWRMWRAAVSTRRRPTIPLPLVTIRIPGRETTSALIPLSMVLCLRSTRRK